MESTNRSSAALLLSRHFVQPAVLRGCTSALHGITPSTARSDAAPLRPELLGRTRSARNSVAATRHHFQKTTRTRASHLPRFRSDRRRYVARRGPSLTHQEVNSVALVLLFLPRSSKNSQGVQMSFRHGTLDRSQEAAAETTACRNMKDSVVVVVVVCRSRCSSAADEPFIAALL